jgi:hypothetical protein
MAGMVIALFVFYPMCITDSQINIQKSAEFFDSAAPSDQEIQVLYIPTTARFQDSERIRMETIQLPIWLNYYAVKKHDYLVTPVQNNNDYQKILRKFKEREVRHILLITDATEIDNTVLEPTVLNDYSIKKVFNQGYHNGYWFDTQQVVILERGP